MGGVSKDWYLMNAYPIYNSGMEQDEFDAYVVSGFEENLDTSPLSIDVPVYRDGWQKTPSTIKAIVQNNSRDGNGTTHIRQIISKRDNFTSGNIVKHQNQFWVIDSGVLNNLIYDKASMVLCNYVLNYLNAGGLAVSYPCRVEKENSLDIKALGTANQMVVGATSISIKLPFDTNTASLDREYPDGKIHRLIIDSRAYQITLADKITTPGVLILTCKESNDLGEDDNLSLGIADYYSRVKSPPPVPKPITTSITFSGKPYLYVGAAYKKFAASFMDSEGFPANLDFTWKISGGVSASDIETEELGQEIKIRVRNSGSVGKTIVLSVMFSGAAIAASQSLEVVEAG